MTEQSKFCPMANDYSAHRFDSQNMKKTNEVTLNEYVNQTTKTAGQQNSPEMYPMEKP